jgi:prepilin-type N-terminal cleavage/methylation domain-containing protein/prepilin-type processing-associated H-X9-DG protein
VSTPGTVGGMGRAGRRARPPRAAQGFTLVELLVVLAIVSALAGLLMPALGYAMAVANETSCLSNLRQIGLAARCYVNDYGAFPRAWQDSECRWMDLLKPYVDKKSEVYRCPADRQQIPVAWDPDITLSYGINCFNFRGEDYCFWYGVGATAVRQASRVILFADCTPGKYYCGGGSTFTDPVKDVDYRHPGGSFCAVFCDGHAESLTQTTQDQWDASR